METTRRRFVSLLAALPLLGCKKPARLDLTPTCTDADEEPTPAQTEGPYFKRQSPERSSLYEAGMAGTLIVLTGRVLDVCGRPVPRALLDWWHADDAGEYDNRGYRLRGHHFADTEGRFRLATIVPGLYPGRTRHFHVKVQAPNSPVLTTQLYFPDEPGNRRDFIFNENLLLNLKSNADQPLTGAFTFVIRT